jgi:hypothetical protein
VYNNHGPCRYGQTYSDEQGLYMICPKDCGCDNRKLSNKEQEYDRQPSSVGYIIGFLVVICFLVCSYVFVNTLMSLVK